MAAAVEFLAGLRSAPAPGLFFNRNAGRNFHWGTVHDTGFALNPSDIPINILLGQPRSNQRRDRRAFRRRILQMLFTHGKVNISERLLGAPTVGEAVQLPPF